MAETLTQCEREVELARSKLAVDLATLRSPSTLSSFTDTLKHEAVDTKDAVIAQAQDAARSKLNDFVEDLKAKAAANPAAALSIGAGLAWHFIRHPPIATALIGAGLYSLWRTNATHANLRDTDDYLRQGKARLKEQVTEFGSSAIDTASDVGKNVGRVVSAKTDEVLDKARDTVQGWSRQAADSAAAAGSAITAQAQSVAATARRGVDDFSEQAGRATTRVRAATNEVVQDTWATGEEVVTKVGTRDNVLLGVAGLAVAAALGMAYQKRVAEPVE